MKPIKISTLKTSVALLLAAGLLSGCGGEAEDAADQNNEVMGDAVQNVEEYVEPVLNIDEYGRISSVDEVEDMGGMDDMDDGMVSMGDDMPDMSESMSDMGDGMSDMMDSVAESTEDAVDAGMEMVDDGMGALDSMLEVAEDEIDGAQDMMVEVQEDVVEASSSAIDELPVEAMMDDATEVVTATNEIIRDVQQGLVNAGFNPGPVDGFSGPRTTAAMESFQQQNGLAVGQLTKETLRALGVDF